MWPRGSLVSLEAMCGPGGGLWRCFRFHPRQKRGEVENMAATPSCHFKQIRCVSWKTTVESPGQQDKMPENEKHRTESWRGRGDGHRRWSHRDDESNLYLHSFKHPSALQHNPWLILTHLPACGPDTDLSLCLLHAHGSVLMRTFKTQWYWKKQHIKRTQKRPQSVLSIFNIIFLLHDVFLFAVGRKKKIV